MPTAPPCAVGMNGADAQSKLSMQSLLVTPGYASWCIVEACRENLACSCAFVCSLWCCTYCCLMSWLIHSYMLCRLWALCQARPLKTMSSMAALPHWLQQVRNKAARVISSLSITIAVMWPQHCHHYRRHAQLFAKTYLVTPHGLSTPCTGALTSVQLTL